MILYAYHVVNTKDVRSHSSTCLSGCKYKGRTFTVLHVYQVVNTKDVRSHDSTCLSGGKYKGRTFTQFYMSISW